MRVDIADTPKVKLHVILDDAFDSSNQTSPTTTTTTSSNGATAAAPPNPVVLESQHRNVTLRCAVHPEPERRNADDDPSLNLTSVHWYWNGVQMQLPNCTRSSDPGDVFEDEDDADTDPLSDGNENNGMNVNYYTSETHGDEDYDVYGVVDNDTARRRSNKKQRKVLCTDRELILVNVTKNIHGNYSCRARNAAGLLTPMSDQTPLIVYCKRSFFFFLLFFLFSTTLNVCLVNVYRVQYQTLKSQCGGGGEEIPSYFVYNCSSLLNF